MKLYQVIKKNSALLLFIIYALLCFILVYLGFKDSASSNLHLLVIYITTLSFIIIMHICISSMNYFVVAIGTLFLFLFLLEVSYFIFYGEVVSEGVLDSIIETNSNEALSMIKEAIKVIPVLILTFLFIFIFKKVIHIKFSLLMPLICYMLCFAISISAINKSAVRIENKKGYYKGEVAYIRHIYPFVFGNVLYLFVGFISTDLYSNTNEIEKFNDSVILPPEESNNNLIILIMGESSLSKRYSVYGYNKQTTPFMTEIFSQENGCIIKNSHSSASLTRDSLAMTLSFNEPESNDNLFDNKSIIEMAKFNNYKTYWLGSQAIKGTFNTKYGFIARKSDVVTLTNEGDINLNKLLEKNLEEDSERKKFFFIHLRGSHLPYNSYDQLDQQALPEADDYDLTIHHTDRVIKSLYDTVKKHSSNFILIYTSDHGENVNVGAGHGMMKGVDQFLIPFMFISTNSKYNCQFIESFRGSEGYLSGLMNKYIISNLLGYKIDQKVVEKEKKKDRVFMSNGSVIPFAKIEPLTEAP